VSHDLSGERLVVAHVLPELLNLYGDRGNVRALVQRATWRGLDVEVRSVGRDDGHRLTDADVLFLGGGPDRQQVAVASALQVLGARICDVIAEGAALLAVCGGFQNLGHVYRSALVGELRGPGVLDVSTDAPLEGRRLVGGVIVELAADSPIAGIGRASAAAAGFGGEEGSIVGFENHGGRTHRAPGVPELGHVPLGHGNDGEDGTEGVLLAPGTGGLRGLRIGTYLHGPLLPRNPHLADFILLSALARRGVAGLDPLADRAEWSAHAAFAATWSRRAARAARPRLRTRI
jgi:CobQ-like glutamine amidotransferase family enzyme